MTDEPRSPDPVTPDPPRESLETPPGAPPPRHPKTLGETLAGLRPLDEIPAPIPEPRPEPPPFPRGFWARVDYLLRNADDVLTLLSRERDLGDLARTFFVVTVLMAAVYGAVMGATNLLQGSAMPMDAKMAMIGLTAAKVPVLFLLTLAIVFPPVFVSNAFAGARFSFQRLLVQFLAAIAITATILASMASVSLFFALTTTGYHFIKLFHVAVFLYAGIVGWTLLERGFEAAKRHELRPTPGKLLLLWAFLYMLVGAQLAWTIRPFVGSPNREFEVFRPKEGNFFISVAESVLEVVAPAPPK